MGEVLWFQGMLYSKEEAKCVASRSSNASKERKTLTCRILVFLAVLNSFPDFVPIDRSCWRRLYKYD